MASKQRVPINNSLINWTPEGSAFNYANVDEYPSTNDSDYNYDAGPNDTDYFGFTALDVPSGATITSIKVVIRGKYAIT